MQIQFYHHVDSLTVSALFHNIFQMCASSGDVSEPGTGWPTQLWCFSWLPRPMSYVPSTKTKLCFLLLLRVQCSPSLLFLIIYDLLILRIRSFVASSIMSSKEIIGSSKLFGFLQPKHYTMYLVVFAVVSVFLYIFRLSVRLDMLTICGVGWLVCLCRECRSDPRSIPKCVNWIV